MSTKKQRDSNRQNISELARTLGLSRSTVNAYARRDDAPKPEGGRYDLHAFHRYLGNVAPRLWDRLPRLAARVETVNDQEEVEDAEGDAPAETVLVQAPFISVGAGIQAMYVWEGFVNSDFQDELVGKTARQIRQALMRKCRELEFEAKIRYSPRDVIRFLAERPEQREYMAKLGYNEHTKVVWWDPDKSDFPREFTGRTDMGGSPIVTLPKRLKSKHEPYDPDEPEFRVDAAVAGGQWIVQRGQWIPGPALK